MSEFITDVPPEDFKLSHNETLADLQQNNDILKLNNFIKIAKQTVGAGGKFQLTDTSNGIELSVHATLTTLAEVDFWVQEMNSLRLALGQTALG